MNRLSTENGIRYMRYNGSVCTVVVLIEINSTKLPGVHTSPDWCHRTTLPYELLPNWNPPSRCPHHLTTSIPYLLLPTFHPNYNPIIQYFPPTTSFELTPSLDQTTETTAVQRSPQFAHASARRSYDFGRHHVQRLLSHILFSRLIGILSWL